jgi:hypothetical protein
MEKKKAGAAGAVVLGVLTWASQHVGCDKPTPVAPVGKPTPVATPWVETQTTTEVVVVRPAGGHVATATPAVPGRPPGMPAQPGEPSAVPTLPPGPAGEVIKIVTKTRTTVHPAPLMQAMPMQAGPQAPEAHARLGVLAGTFPGVVALDVQLVRGTPLRPLADWHVLPQAAGALEVSLDVEANLNQAGLAIAAGDKVFAALGYQGSWAPAGHGPFVGVGMRF